MRQCWLGLLAVTLAGCAAEGTTGTGPDRTTAVQACAAAVAAHVGKGVDAVAASWTGETAAGVGVVTVRDMQAGGAERVHSCEVDGEGRVLAIRHPGA